MATSVSKVDTACVASKRLTSSLSTCLSKSQQHPRGCKPKPFTPGLWCHLTKCTTLFVLCIDDFGVKCFSKPGVPHLINAVKTHQSLTVNWSGNPRGQLSDPTLCSSHAALSPLSAGRHQSAASGPAMARCKHRQRECSFERGELFRALKINKFSSMRAIDTGASFHALNLTSRPFVAKNVPHHMHQVNLNNLQCQSWSRDPEIQGRQRELPR